MSKSRKKVFPKKPERLTTTSAKLLGKNSNKACYEASVKAIYNSQPKIIHKLTHEQKRLIAAFKKQLQSNHQDQGNT
jgi:hypothetical protein